MPTIVEQIEMYLKDLLNHSSNGSIEIRRADLAQFFACAPSQINYVLGTRFTPERGFIVETRRGGGGYVRISRIVSGYNQLLKEMQGCCNNANLEGFILQLYDEGMLTKRETAFIREMLRPTIAFEQKEREIFSSHLLKALAIFLREG